MEKIRLLELDAIRGLAAIGVVLYHYFYRYNEIYGHSTLTVQWSYFGQYGVHLFFIVSGFVIFWTLQKVEKPADFIVSRFSRLYPAFWVAVPLTFSIVYFFGLPGRQVSLESALINLFMFHEYFGISHVDGVYWTLTVELTFYFWMFTVYIFGLLEKVEYFFIPVLIVSILHSVGLVDVGVIKKILILNYASLFLAGICFYRLARNQYQIRSILFLLFSLIAIFYAYSFTVFILITVFYVIFLISTTRGLAVLRVRALVFLGSISYSLYLLHQNIGYVVLNGNYKLGIDPLLSVAIALLITLLLASLSFFYVEKPMLIFIRKRYKDSRVMNGLSKKSKVL
ncbi:MAG: acyltransferase [Candidatus Thiodiazotropha sp. (ex. Lucinisca nassula)]|nr:acyltransferase [Candidatus Thiodiazotropha sp. (ex. Lucinisca nassula)]